jgi:DNA end-binding protein Ku
MARPVWRGAISFGLVNVPVKAYPAVRSHDVHFHQIDKRTGSRIRIRKVSAETGEEVAPDDIALGFEVGEGRYVRFEKGELEELRPASTRTIEVTDFVALDQIDPIYYERPYWLAPDGEVVGQAYQLLRAAMEDLGRVAIGGVVMRDRQYLAAIRPLDGALAMSTLRFADEVVPRSEVEDIPDQPAEPDPKLLAMATQIIDSLTTDWDASRYRDTFTDELRERIKAKGAGEEITAPGEAAEPKVVDVMQALEASVASIQGRKGPQRKSRTRARDSA